MNENFKMGGGKHKPGFEKFQMLPEVFRRTAKVLRFNLNPIKLLISFKTFEINNGTFDDLFPIHKNENSSN